MTNRILLYVAIIYISCQSPIAQAKKLRSSDNSYNNLKLQGEKISNEIAYFKVLLNQLEQSGSLVKTGFWGVPHYWYSYSRDGLTTRYPFERSYIKANFRAKHSAVFRKIGSVKLAPTEPLHNDKSYKNKQLFLSYHELKKILSELKKSDIKKKLLKLGVNSKEINLALNFYEEKMTVLISDLKDDFFIPLNTLHKGALFGESHLSSKFVSKFFKGKVGSPSTHKEIFTDLIEKGYTFSGTHEIQQFDSIDDWILNGEGKFSLLITPTRFTIAAESKSSRISQCYDLHKMLLNKVEQGDADKSNVSTYTEFRDVYDVNKHQGAILFNENSCQGIWLPPAYLASNLIEKKIENIESEISSYIDKYNRYQKILLEEIYRKYSKSAENNEHIEF